MQGLSCLHCPRALWPWSVSQFVLQMSLFIGFLQVLGYLDPYSLLHLCRTSKAFRSLLLTRPARDVWKHALAARKHIVIADEDDDDELEAKFRAAAAASTSASQSRRVSKARSSTHASSSSLSPPPECIFDSDTSPPTSSPPDSVSSYATSISTIATLPSNKVEAASDRPPYAEPVLVGLLIETLAQSRASALSPSALYRDAVCNRGGLKSERAKKEWLRVITDSLEEGRLRGVFGCVRRDTVRFLILPQ
jgi:hypothetical protein